MRLGIKKQFNIHSLFDFNQITPAVALFLLCFLYFSTPAQALNLKWLLGGQKTEKIDSAKEEKDSSKEDISETTTTVTTTTSSTSTTNPPTTTTTVTVPPIAQTRPKIQAESAAVNKPKKASSDEDKEPKLYSYIQLRLEGGTFPIKNYQGHVINTVSDDATIEIRVPFETLLKASQSKDSDEKILNIKAQSSDAPLDFFNGNDILDTLDLATLLNGAQDYSIENDPTPDGPSRLQYVRVLDGGYSPNFRQTIDLRGYLDVKSLLKKQSHIKVYRYLSVRKVKVRIRSRKGVRYAYKNKKEYVFGHKKVFGSRVEISGFQIGNTVVRSLSSAPVADDQIDQGFEPGDEPISETDINDDNSLQASAHSKKSKDNKIIEIEEDDETTAADNNPNELNTEPDQNKEQSSEQIQDRPEKNHPAKDNLKNSNATQVSEKTRVENAIEYLQKVAKAGPAGFCFRYIKLGLVYAGLVKEYPGEEAAKNAGPQLLKNNFVNLLSLPSFRKKIKSPFDAPAGAILVYHGYPYGHIEMRTEDGFISDYFSKRARTGYASDGLANRGVKLIGVYIKTALK